MKTHLCTLLIIFAVCQHSVAHQQEIPHHHKPQSHKNNTDAETRAITQLMSILHHAVSGKHQHVHSVKDFFTAFKNKEQWKHLLSFRKITLHTARAFNMESNKNQLANHVKNLALLFPLSHFIEVITAPAFVSIGTIHEFPSIVIGLGGSLLSIIAVPGLDPLCILILSAYPLKPVHRSVDAIRSFAEKSVRGIFVTLRLNTLLSKTHTYEDRFHLIKKEIETKKKLHQLFEIELQTLPEGVQLSLSNKKDGSPILVLKRVQDTKTHQFYIQSVWMAQTAENAAIRNVLSLLSWNARSAIRELLKIKDSPQKIQSYEREFFVNQITVQDNGIEVLYKEKAIPLKNSFRMKNNVRTFLPASCKALMQR